MRILIILLFISFNSLFISFNSLGQGFAFVKVEDKPSKFYLGIGGGVAFRGGAINYGYYNTGINLSLLNMGYRINERFGVSFNLNSSGHSFHSQISRVGIGYMSIGGIISVPIKQFTWDIKPQYAPLVVGQYFGDVLLYTYTDEIFMMGNGKSAPSLPVSLYGARAQMKYFTGQSTTGNSRFLLKSHNRGIASKLASSSLEPRS